MTQELHAKYPEGDGRLRFAKVIARARVHVALLSPPLGEGPAQALSFVARSFGPFRGGPFGPSPTLFAVSTDHAQLLMMPFARPVRTGRTRYARQVMLTRCCALCLLAW